MKHLVALICLGIALTHCQDSDKIHFFIQNTVKEKDSVHISVAVNSEILIDEYFHYSLVRPNYSKFTFDNYYVNSELELRVESSNTELKYLDTVNLSKYNHVFIQYSNSNELLSLSDTVIYNTAEKLTVTCLESADEIR